MDATDNRPLEEKVLALEKLKHRIKTRLTALRRSQVAIMIERNLYLSKLREVEEYGRRHKDKQSSDELLQSIYHVLYDEKLFPPTMD